VIQILENNSYIDDPFYNMNSKNMSMIENRNYTFINQIKFIQKNKNVYLEFDGIDTHS